MSIILKTPSVDELRSVIEALREWQNNGHAVQLHPGDIGWFWRFGDIETARAVRFWVRDGETVAICLLDGPDLVRLALQPEVKQDMELARQLARDLSSPQYGVVPAGQEISVEAPLDAIVRTCMSAESGWIDGEPFTYLVQDLSQPIQLATHTRIQIVGPELMEARTAVHRAAFNGSTFTADRWAAMARSPAYGDAKCLLAFDLAGTPVAVATVWHAGRGKPGLLEPMGVAAEHRGKGYGKAICVAAAAELQNMGASTVQVGTPSSNEAAIRTYRAAGFNIEAEVRDKSRTS